MKITKNIKIIIAVVLAVLLLSLIGLLFLKQSKISLTDLEMNGGALAVKNERPSEQTFLVDNKPAVMAADRVIGNQSAVIKIFAYEDINPFSAALAADLKRLQAEYGDDLALIIRPFISKNNVLSRNTALLAECAADEGKWLEMREALFSALAEDSLDLTNPLAYGQLVGLNESNLKNCLAAGSEKYDRLNELAKEAERLEVVGAPTMFIDGEMIIGARPYDDYTDNDGQAVDGLKTLIERKLER